MLRRGLVPLAVLAWLASSCFMLSTEKRLKRAAAELRGQPGFQERDVESTEGRLHVIRTGRADGPLVLFIHGTPGDWRGWTEFLGDPDLQAQATLLAYDRPGFGDSGPQGAVASLTRQAEAIAPQLAGRKGRTIVVGHSYGGPVAVQLALDHPQDVGALLLLAGSVDPGQEEVKVIQRFGRNLLLRWLVPRELDNCNFECLALKGDLEAQAPRLKELKLPVRFIQGSKDDLVPPANADYAKKMFVNADLKVQWLEGEDHFFLWREPKIVKDALAAMLGSMSKGR